MEPSRDEGVPGMEVREIQPDPAVARIAASLERIATVMEACVCRDAGKPIDEAMTSICTTRGPAQECSLRRVLDLVDRISRRAADRDPPRPGGVA